MATPRLCSDIQIIDRTEPIGNSLVKINRNFSSLRSDICNIVNSFNPLINVTGIVKGTGTSFATAIQNVDYYKPNTLLQYPLSITGAFSCGGAATITGDTTINSNLIVGSTSKSTELHLTGNLKSKHFASSTGLYFIGNQINASPDVAAVDELALNFVGFNAGVTQFRNLNVYNGKKQSLMLVEGSTGKVTIGSPGSRGDLLTIYGSISATGVVYGGSVNSSVNVTTLSAPGANDGDVLTYVVQNVLSNNPNTSNPVTTPSTARLNIPASITIDSSQNLYVTDYGNNSIRKITPAGVVSTIAGGRGSGFTNGTGPDARFNGPFGITVDSSGNLYVADKGNMLIRKVTPTGVTSTLLGAGNFNWPHGITIDSSGNLYVADTHYHAIRKITFTGATATAISIIAGVEGQQGNSDGIGSAARFRYPHAITIDSTGNLYVADTDNNAIRKVTPTGVTSTIAGGFNQPYGITIDSSGNLYVADSLNYAIKKITPAGVVSTIAGLAGQRGSTDGTGSGARFSTPTGITIDSSGNLYVADQGNQVIRKITPAGVVSTFAGVAGQRGNADGLVAITDIAVSIPLVSQVGSWVPRPMTVELPRVANNKDVLTYNSTTSRWVAAAVPGDAPNSITLDKLSIAGATAGNVIVYNPATMQWGPANPPSSLPATAANNQVLVYDTTAGSWIPKDISNIVMPTVGLKKNEITTTTNVAVYALTLSADANPESYLVYLNGVMQSPGTDYTISPNGRITLIPAPAGALKLTVMAVRNTNGVVSPSTGTGPTNSGLNPGSEGQVLTYTSSQWVGVNPSVLPSQIKQGGATAGQILSYNGTSWVPANNTPSVSPTQLLASGAKNGQVLMFNSASNTWAASSLPIAQSTTNQETIYINTDQTYIYKLCEASRYNNPNEYNDGFGFIDSTREVRVLGASKQSRFGPVDMYNINGYGTLPLPSDELAEKLYINSENVLVITLSGNVYISGRNTEGQCAQGSGNLVNQPALVKAQGLSNIKELATGPNVGTDASAFYAVSNDGKLFSWGYNQYGPIGDGTTTARSTPVQTLGPGNTYGNSTQKVVQVIAIPGWDGSSNPTVAAALLEDGSVWCAGYGGRGNMGDGNTTSVVSKWVRVKVSSTTFLQGITKICGVGNSGYSTIWALDNAGNVWGWGRGTEGQIGDNNNVDRYYATQMYTSHLSPKPVIVDFYPIGGGDGQAHGIFLKSSTGMWYACGGNSNGQLGLGNTTNRNRMELITNLTGKNIQYIASNNYGGYQSFAVSPDKIYSTGNNNDWGSLGLGNSNNVTVFTEVRLRAKSSATQLLDVRPLYVYGGHFQTYVFSNIDKKLYLAGSLVYDVETGARGAGWKLRYSFQEITRDVL
jgi:alpha-tubulin suppressor-like RCC1 family protein/streptogramin lyase